MNAKKIIIGSLAAAIILAGGGIFYAKKPGMNNRLSTTFAACSPLIRT